MIPISASLGVAADVEFNPVKNENGVISLIPVRQRLYDRVPNVDLRAAIEADDLG